MSTPPVLIHVQHLLGVGHLRRAAALARALSAVGLDVTLASGGPPDSLELGAARLVQLEPVRAADAAFSGLVDRHGRALDDAFKARRRAQVLALLNEVQPRALITEMFPFGRRQLRFELLPLIETVQAMTPRPRIVCSVRDILVEKNKPERTREMAALARRYYDRVLVHGDARLVPFGASFPLAEEIAGLIAYTGYVASGSTMPAPPGVGDGEIVVSAGGGAVGQRLIEAALAARSGDERLRAWPWRVLAGAALSTDEMAALRVHADRGVMIERARPDFPSLLGRAALSVSQAGYNTVMDILAARVRSVLVPFAAGHETEQSVRAEALAVAGRAIVVPEAALSSEALARAMHRALEGPAPGPSAYALDGAATTARLVLAMVEA